MSMQMIFGEPLTMSVSGDSVCEVFDFDQLKLFVTFFRNELMWAEVSIPGDGKNLEHVVAKCLEITSSMGSVEADPFRRDLLRIRSMLMVAIVMLGVGKEVECMRMMLSTHGLMNYVLGTMVYGFPDSGSIN